ncbi:MAG TPA: PKD domain-containing protein, partial [Chitinophagaceae bacterium]|nr:PKD domain-containing protein [Chitinophagaceae bacterium]
MKRRWAALCVLFFLLPGSLLAQLSASFSAADTAMCAPVVVQFSDQSAGQPGQWYWDLGNGVTSRLQHPSTTYFNPGTYTVKLVVRNAAGADSLVKQQYITVHPNPEVRFTASDSVGCFPMEVAFRDVSATTSGQLQSWTWDFGDGTTSVQQHPAHRYTARGNFSVTLQVTNSFGCVRTESKTAYIRASGGIKASFTHSGATGCQAPATIQFSNASTGDGITGYRWDFGDGASSTEASPRHTYTRAGTYEALLVAYHQQGCTDTFRKTLSIGTVAAVIQAPPSVCVGTRTVFTHASTPAGGTASWSFSDGTQASGNTAVKEFTTPGTYTVQLIYRNGACADTARQLLVVQPRVAPRFTASETVACGAPFTVRFQPEPAVNRQYRWDFGDGTTSTEVSPAHTYTAEGSYTVSLISTNENGCSDTLVRSGYILLRKPPIRATGIPATGCAPLLFTPSAVAEGDRITGFRWLFGDGTESTEPRPRHLYSSAGTYTVTLIATLAGGCTDTVVWQDAVRAGTRPDADFELHPADVCAKDPVTFTDKSAGAPDQWLWNFGDRTVSNAQHPSHVYQAVGPMTVSLVVWNNTCPDTVVKRNVVMVRPPIASFRLIN